MNSSKKNGRENIESQFFSAADKPRLPLIFHYTDACEKNSGASDDDWKEGDKWLDVPFYQTPKYFPEIFYKPVSKFWKM